MKLLLTNNQIVVKEKSDILTVSLMIKSSNQNNNHMFLNIYLIRRHKNIRYITYKLIESNESLVKYTYFRDLHHQNLLKVQGEKKVQFQRTFSNLTIEIILKLVSFTVNHNLFVPINLLGLPERSPKT